MADIGSILGGLGVGGNIGKAIVQLELDSKKYIAELKGAEAETNASAKKMSTGFASFGSAGTAAAVGITAALGAMAVKGVATFQQVGSEVRTLEKQLGITAEQASVLRAQGEALGVGVDKLSTGFGILAKHLVANDDVIHQYGLTVSRTADGTIDFQAILGQLHTVFEAMGPSADRTAAAMNLFGRSGKNLLPILAANSDELDQFAQNAEDAGLIMSEQDVQASRDLSIAGRELNEAWTGLEVTLARDLVPAITSLTKTLTGLFHSLRPILPAVLKIGAAFLAWKALSFIPKLIGSITIALGDFAAAGAGIATGGGLAAALGGIAAALPAIATAGPLAAAALVEVWDSMQPSTNPADEIIAANVALSAIPQEAQDRISFIAYHFEDAGRNAASFKGQVDEVNKALADAGIKYTLTTGALENLVKGYPIAGLGAGALATAQEAATAAMDKAGHAARRLGFSSKSAFQEFKQAAVESTRVTIGQFEKVGDAFSITPTELRKQLGTAIKIAKRFGEDLKAILTDKDLTEKQKQALAALPPEYRRAFVEAGDAGKKELANQAVKLSNLNKRQWGDFAKKASPDAKKGGGETGEAYMTGAIAGIIRKEPALVAQIRASVRKAIQAGKDEAGAASPSKEMIKLGKDLMDGLAKGIRDNGEKVAQAVEAQIQKVLDKAKAALDKAKSAASSFRGGISGGFSSLGDLSGLFGLVGEQGVPGSPSNLSVMFGNQVDIARQFAQVLEALQRQGASKGLLSQIAGAGPEAIPFAQALLQGGPELVQDISDQLAAIQKISEKTSKNLTQDYFGDRIEKLGNKIERTNAELREIKQFLARGHDHDIIVDGNRLMLATRSSANRNSKRNGGNTGF